MADGRNLAPDRPGFEDFDDGASALGDRWELVGFPSPRRAPAGMPDTPPADTPANAACASVAYLQENDLPFASRPPEANVLPLSTGVATAPHGEPPSPSRRTSSSEFENMAHLPYRSSISTSDEDVDSPSSECSRGRVRPDGYVLHDESVHCTDNLRRDDNPSYCMFFDDISDGPDSSDNHAIYTEHSCEIINEGDFTMPANVIFDHTRELLNTNYVNSVDALRDNVAAMEAGGNIQDLTTSAISEVSEPTVASLPAQISQMESECLVSDDRRTTVAGTSCRPASVEADKSSDTLASCMNICGSKFFKIRACASWLWTQLCRWQTHVGYTNTIWSIAFSVALMGLLFLRRGLQRLQAQNYSLRSQLWAKEKRITQLMFQLMQTKEISARIRRVPVICGKSASQISQGEA